MTHDEIIAVIQAHKEGKKIQYRFRGKETCSFQDLTSNPVFNFEMVDYRVKPELTREEITAKWVKDNDVKIGDRVRVIEENGSDTFKKANSLAKGIWDVSDISKTHISVSYGDHCFSLQVEQMQKLTYKLVKFDYEDRKLFRGQWLVVNDTFEALIITITKDKMAVQCYGFLAWFSYEEALEKCKFTNGKPFGKEVWE